MPITDHDFRPLLARSQNGIPYHQAQAQPVTMFRVQDKVEKKNRMTCRDKAGFKNKKTTRRWFHDTAYCFDYSAFIPMVPGVGLEPT
ncbi:hypothetical protein, partial [Klebsiella quasipneumoniae]|uniref:hypothetical protein n=1 Tax=Klebsiella quasipneumoniae TaxID=1463165 RepID=UPI001C60A9E2